MIVMNKRELLEKSLQSGFEDYELNHLSTMGDFLGRYPTLFKKIYRAFNTMEDSVKFEPEVGPSVSIILKRELNEVTISRLNLNIVFDFDKFLRFIGLVDICYIEILPIGSVVELDLDFVPENIKKISEKDNKGFRVMIVAQKVSIEESEYIFADYAVTFWPFGIQKYGPPFLISNLMIKNLIHKGMSNDAEKEYLDKVKEKLVAHKMNSFMYLTKSELKEVAVNPVKKGDLDG